MQRGQWFGGLGQRLPVSPRFSMTMAVRESRAGIEPRASQDKNCLALGSAMGEISVLLGGGLSSGSCLLEFLLLSTLLLGQTIWGLWCARELDPDAPEYTCSLSAPFSLLVLRAHQRMFRSLFL